MAENKDKQIPREYQNLHLYRQTNILDPIHDGLTTYVFEDGTSAKPKMRPHIRQWLIDHVHEFLSKFHDHPEQWASLVLTGSLTTYQYSDESDVDISVFVNPAYLPEWDRAALIGMVVSGLDGTKVAGTPYPIQTFIVSPKIQREDLYQPGLRSGYDIDKDEWIIPPDKNRTHDVQKEYDGYYIYALESADKMEHLLEYEPDKAVMYWHQIHKRRQRDQAAGKGDYSESNIVYKFLNNRGLFPKIEEVSGEHIATTESVNMTPIIYDWTNDHISGNVPNVVQHNTGKSLYVAPGIFDWRVPIVHNLSTGDTHLGDPGSEHEQVYRGMTKGSWPSDTPIKGWLSIHDTPYEEAGNAGWFNNEDGGHEPLEAAANHYGLQYKPVGPDVYDSDLWTDEPDDPEILG